LTVSFAAVDFDLSTEQQDLRNGAIDLLERAAPADRVRAFVGPGSATDSEGAGGVGGDHAGSSDSSGYDRALWEAMAGQGWLGVARGEELGGLGLGMVEVAVLCEELGRRVAPAPYASTVVCLAALDGAATDEGVLPEAGRLAAGWAEEIATGSIIGAVAWSAGGGVVAHPDGDRWSLTGRPEPTLYASVADLVVVVTGDGVFALPLDEGTRPRAEPAMDRTRPLAWLRLDGTPAHRIGGADAAQWMVDGAATACSAELLGASARALEMSTEYAKVRKQFGHPIGSFQAVKHRLADALVDVEGMRSTTYHAAWCLASDHPDRSLAASVAKAWCSDASRRVMAAGLQVHGGIGFTWDHDLHLLLKRAQLDATSFGTATWHRERIAELLERQLAEGVTLF
jgi:alkylation response protein AidB-like acyl-CoA dehydrogenase